MLARDAARAASPNPALPAEVSGGALQEKDRISPAESWLADVAHDEQWRREWIGKLSANPQVYVEAEDATIAEGTALFASFAKAAGAPKEVKFLRAVLKAQTKHDTETGRTVGMATCTVRASPEDISAWLMHLGSKILKSYADPAVDVRAEMLEDVNDHHRIGYYEAKSPPLRNRTFLSCLVLKRISDDPLVYVWVAAPIEKHKRITHHDERHAVRASGIRCCRMTRVAENDTLLEYACTLDLNGQVPAFITNSVAIPNLMVLPYKIQRYFQQILPADRSMAEDGVTVARMLLHAMPNAGKAARAAAVSNFVAQTAVLRDAPLAHLSTVLKTMLARGGSGLTAGNVATLDPAALTKAEARTIGEGVAPILRGHTVPADAADELLRQYSALRATAESCAWFRPMLEALLTQQLATSLSAVLRQTVAASASLLDTGSDIYSMAVYFASGQFVVGFSICAMMVLNAACQTLVVTVRNANRGRREVAKEVLIVLSFLKPLFDMRRMMTGHRVDGAPFDTYTERNYCKGLETAVESYPSCVIQIVASLSAYHLSGSISWAAVASILFSWLATAFKATAMEVGAHTNKALRKYHPRLFGYSPDSRAQRRGVKAFLFSLILSHVILSTLTVALVYTVRPAWLAAFVGTSIGLVLAYKAARSDLRYYVPGASGIFTSLLERALVHLFVETTGMPYFRSPFEEGGACWLLTMGALPVRSMLAGWLYVAYFEGPGKLPSDLVFAVLGVLVGVWAVSFAGFLLTIKREYVGTFLSLETGCAYAVRFFNQADGDDERRIKIFNFAEALWSEIRGDVKDWTLDNYKRWKAEKPPWFTVGLIKRLPDDFMPAADVAALDARAPGGKRKSLANMGPHKRFRSSLLTPAEDAADATLILPKPQAEDAAVSAGPAPEPHAPTASEAQPPDVPIESETRDGACHSLGRPLLLGSVAVAGPSGKGHGVECLPPASKCA